MYTTLGKNRQKMSNGYYRLNQASRENIERTIGKAVPPGTAAHHPQQQRSRSHAAAWEPSCRAAAQEGGPHTRPLRGQAAFLQPVRTLRTAHRPRPCRAQQLCRRGCPPRSRRRAPVTLRRRSRRWLDFAGASNRTLVPGRPDLSPGLCRLMRKRRLWVVSFVGGGTAGHGALRRTGRVVVQGGAPGPHLREQACDLSPPYPLAQRPLPLDIELFRQELRQI